MIRRIMLVSAAAGLMIAIGGCKDGGGMSWITPTPKVEGAVEIRRQYAGDDSSLKYPFVRLVNSQAELEAMGAVELARQGIRFDRQSVILLAVGEKPTSGYWGRIRGVQKQGSEIYVQGVVNRPGEGELTMQVLTYPYAAVVVPKMTGTLHPEIDSVQGQAPPAN
jgi:hypothetical protein